MIPALFAAICHGAGRAAATLAELACIGTFALAVLLWAAIGAGA